MEIVNATAVTDNSATITWTRSVDKVDNYIVKVVGDDGVSITNSVSADTTSLVVAGLKENTKYNVTVLAVKNGENSTATEFEFKTRSSGK